MVYIVEIKVAGRENPIIENIKAENELGAMDLAYELYQKESIQDIKVVGGKNE